MKKVIVLLGIAALLLNSCLGVDRNYSESAVVFIAMDNGIVYGRTLTGKFIASSEIDLLEPGTFKFMTYSWEEERGTVAIGTNFYADNVLVSGDIEDIDQDFLRLIPVPETEVPKKFVNVAQPVYHASDAGYLDDHWLFEYTYEATKDEIANVEFYWNEARSNVEQGKAYIDIHLVIDGASGGSLTSKTDVVALDMAPLRTMYEGSSQVNTKRIDIQFTYYRKDRTDPIDSQIYSMLVAGD